MDVFECLIAKEDWKPSKEDSLRFLYNDYEISNEELLLQTDRATMNVKRLRILCTKIYKT